MTLCLSEHFLMRLPQANAGAILEISCEIATTKTPSEITDCRHHFSARRGQIVLEPANLELDRIKVPSFNAALTLTATCMAT